MTTIPSTPFTVIRKVEPIYKAKNLPKKVAFSYEKPLKKKKKHILDILA